MPLTFTANNADVAGFTVPWWVPVLMLAVVATAIAYTLGISGVARLRPSFASLVGLGEVLFAVLTAWVLLGEAVTAMQGVGGVVVLFGLALARHGDRSAEVTAATWPDAGPIEEVAASA
jgi:drug/metabolite transporter (DMT)-like permease